MLCVRPSLLRNPGRIICLLRESQLSSVRAGNIVLQYNDYLTPFNNLVRVLNAPASFAHSCRSSPDGWIAASDRKLDVWINLASEEYVAAVMSGGAAVMCGCNRRHQAIILSLRKASKIPKTFV
jgi:hypothetical protein